MASKKDSDALANMGCLSTTILLFGVFGIGWYSGTYSTSYKELIFLWGLLAAAALIPLWVRLYQWWTAPWNQTGIKRWEFEAVKEETFLAWCRTQKGYGSNDTTDLDLREVYRAEIEEQVRDLDAEELLQWCRDNLEKKGFWKGAGQIFAGLAEVAFLLLGDGDDE